MGEISNTFGLKVMVKSGLKKYFWNSYIREPFSFNSFYLIEMRTFAQNCKFSNGKWLSEALIFASSSPQYDNRLFFESPVQYMKIPSSEHVV